MNDDKRIAEIQARCEATIGKTLCPADFKRACSELINAREDIPYLLAEKRASAARAEKAETYICQLKKQLSGAMKERDELKQILDMYGGEEGITVALKERDTYKARAEKAESSYPSLPADYMSCVASSRPAEPDEDVGWYIEASIYLTNEQYEKWTAEIREANSHDD